MSFFRKIFGGAKKTSSSKPSRPDSPTNKIIKKFLFYGFFFFTTATILSKKYKTNLIFSFQPTDQNVKIIDTNPVFHQGVYNPVYWMLFGPLQRYYAKKFQDVPYFRAVSEPATQQIQQIFQLPVHDKYSKKENLSVVVLITGAEGLDNVVKKLMLSMNTNGFKTVCIKTDDFHNIQRLKKTVDYIKNKNPNSKIYGIGVEYGANLLVNFASQNEKLFNGIVSIGNPLDLEKSQRNIQNSNFLWKNLLYKDLVKGRIQSCQNNRKLFGDKPVLPQDTELYEIDRACYSGDYQDYQQLKQKLSSINSVKNLTIPSLFIQSQQDPFSISLEQNQQKLENPNCIFVQTQRGGHLQWFESLKKIRWIARPIATYLRYLDGRLAGFTQVTDKPL